MIAPGLFFYSDTRLMMLRRRRRVFVRQLVGGFALLAVFAWATSYF